MLPNCRQDEYLYPVPKFDLNIRDLEDFNKELKEFHNQFYDCFQRSESRKHFFRYMVGQFSELERKSIEPIAFNVEDGQVRAMQRFISDAPWDDDKIVSKYRNLVKQDLGSSDGALVFDETGFLKKGDNSIGVARQYCGAIGKVENCQVGVFTAYVSEYGYAFVDKRLFIPEKWFLEEYKDRRKKCKLPDSLEFKTKPQLAAEMLLNISTEKTLPFKYVLADTVYGMSPEFIKALESLVDVTYFVSIPESVTCWLRRPDTIKKEYKYRGETRTKTVLADPKNKPVKISVFAKTINDYFWYRRQVSEGTKCPIVYEFTKRKIFVANARLPQKEVWLVIRRTIEDNPDYSYYISNAQVSTRLPTFVWLSGLRWAIEQCIKECKTELGMDHYEVRKFPAWHHHIITSILAHFFLWHLKIRLGKKSTIYYTIAA